MEEYLRKVKERLNDKGLSKFWCFPERITFKPLMISKEDVIRKVQENKSKYVGKTVAFVKVSVLSYDGLTSSNDDAIRIMISIYIILQDCSLTSKGGNTISINYRPSDIELRKFTTKDLYKFIQLCANKDIRSDPIGGVTLENLLKKLKKQKINLDD